MQITPSAQGPSELCGVTNDMWQARRRHYARVFVTALALYLVFVVNLGSGTLAEHLYRLALTPEAQQLAAEVYDTLSVAGRALMARLRQFAD